MTLDRAAQALWRALRPVLAGLFTAAMVFAIAASWPAALAAWALGAGIELGARRQVGAGRRLLLLAASAAFLGALAWSVRRPG